MNPKQPQKKRRYKPKPKPLYTPNLYAVLSGEKLTINPPLPPKKETRK